LAVVSFVCSVGNIPLAAALWAHGVAFGGVISFIFADLVTLPLLLIYRRFYGTNATLRLFAVLWFVMSAGGLIVDRLSHLVSLVPRSHHVRFTGANFELGWTLALNIVATVVLVTIYLLARSSRRSTSVATDPICGMTVDTSAPSATRQVGHVTHYFCSPRCAERFDQRHEDAVTGTDSANAVDSPER
jgi:YHS domain-containing protein